MSSCFVSCDWSGVPAGGVSSISDWLIRGYTLAISHPILSLRVPSGFGAQTPDTRSLDIPQPLWPTISPPMPITKRWQTGTNGTVPVSNCGRCLKLSPSASNISGECGMSRVHSCVGFSQSRWTGRTESAVTRDSYPLPPSRPLIDLRIFFRDQAAGLPPPVWSDSSVSTCCPARGSLELQFTFCLVTHSVSCLTAALWWGGVDTAGGSIQQTLSCHCVPAIISQNNTTAFIVVPCLITAKRWAGSTQQPSKIMWMRK